VHRPSHKRCQRLPRSLIRSAQWLWNPEAGAGAQHQPHASVEAPAPARADKYWAHGKARAHHRTHHFPLPFQGRDRTRCRGKSRETPHQGAFRTSDDRPGKSFLEPTRKPEASRVGATVGIAQNRLHRACQLPQRGKGDLALAQCQRARNVRGDLGAEDVALLDDAAGAGVLHDRGGHSAARVSFVRDIDGCHPAHWARIERTSAVQARHR
jgi:hypothetical protein